MKTKNWAIAIGLLASAGLLYSGLALARPETVVKLDSRRSLGTPKTFRNLTIIPIYDTNAPSTDTFMTLEEGLKAKVVVIKEKGQGGEVNTLLIKYTGKKPLYLMAGEVVLGGQQDRCIGKSLIIQPGKKEVEVTVFCVEHGRWTGKKEFDTSSKTVAGKDVRYYAQEGGFNANRPASGEPNRVAGRQGQNNDSNPAVQRAESRENSVRIPSRLQANRQQTGGQVDVGRAQSEVWDNVAKKNAKFKAESNSGTYRNVLEQNGGETSKQIKPYLDAFKGGLGTDRKLVGAVVAVNGEVIAADIFGEPALFKKLWGKLLNSYVTDAAENVPSDMKKIKTVTAEQAKLFLAEASDTKTAQENKTDASSTLRLESKNTLKYQVSPSGFGGGGMGGGTVHTNVLKK